MLAKAVYGALRRSPDDGGSAAVDDWWVGWDGMGWDGMGWNEMGLDGSSCMHVVLTG